MSHVCSICNSAYRADIENAILSMTSAATPEQRVSIEEIAAQFDVDIDALKAHALFHAPMVTRFDIPQTTDEMEDVAEEPKAGDSLTRRMKLHEADQLATVINEYMVTLKAMGRRINRLASTSTIPAEEEDKQYALAKLLTKPMVDLYLGLGGEIRQTCNTMADIDRKLNGPQETAGSGLTALAEAIRSSAAE